MPAASSNSAPSSTKPLDAGSNLPFQDWTSVFASERLTGALLDRITHHVHILEMNANWTHPGKVEAPYTVCIASASNLTGLVKSSVECRRTGL